MMDLAPDPDSGAAGTEYQTIRYLQNLGHEVDAVWGPDLGRRIRHGNLHYLLELPYAYRAHLRRRFSRSDYDVIHVNQPHGFLAARDLPRLDGRAVFVHRSHGLELRAERDLEPWRRCYDPEERSYLRRTVSAGVRWGLRRHFAHIVHHADGHIVSVEQCADLLRQVGVTEDRIAVIPQAPPEVYHERPLAENSTERWRRVLYVSQYAFFKAPMIVAAAINRLAAVDELLEFTWICSRTHHPAVRRLLLPPVRDRVKLLDWMSQSDLIDTLDRHGIFLFPSFFEGFGKVFLEAMARGLCVVAANNSGARDVIRSGTDGILVPTGDADALAAFALQLSRNPRFAEAVSNAAATRAREYTWRRVASETASFYERLLQRKQGLTA